MEDSINGHVEHASEKSHLSHKKRWIYDSITNSKSDNSFDREYAAKNKLTPSEILIKLSKDDSYIVRRSVASNMNIPLEASKILSKDLDTQVRCYLAGNWYIPVDILAFLSKDEKEDVRLEVVTHPNITSTILDSMKYDSSKIVRAWVAKRTSSPETLNYLSVDKDETVRVAVSQNNNIPLDILMKLMKDEDYKVRKGAFSSFVVNNKITEYRKLHSEYENVPDAWLLELLSTK